MTFHFKVISAQMAKTSRSKTWKLIKVAPPTAWYCQACQSTNLQQKLEGTSQWPWRCLSENKGKVQLHKICWHKIAIAHSTAQPRFTNQVFTHSFGHVQSLICWRSQVQANGLIGHAGIINCKRAMWKSKTTNIYTSKCAMHLEMHPAHTHTHIQTTIPSYPIGSRSIHGFFSCGTCFYPLLPLKKLLFPFSLSCSCTGGRRQWMVFLLQLHIWIIGRHATVDVQ